MRTTCPAGDDALPADPERPQDAGGGHDHRFAHLVETRPKAEVRARHVPRHKDHGLGDDIGAAQEAGHHDEAEAGTQRARGGLARARPGDQSALLTAQHVKARNGTQSTTERQPASK